jgi:hypothetical protein
MCEWRRRDGELEGRRQRGEVVTDECSSRDLLPLPVKTNRVISTGRNTGMAGA